MSEPREPQSTTDGATAGAGIGGENPTGGPPQAAMMKGANGAIAGLAVVAYFLCRQGRPVLFAISILLIVVLALINLILLVRWQAALARRPVPGNAPGRTGEHRAYGGR